jgi:hypothetical protein
MKKCAEPLHPLWVHHSLALADSLSYKSLVRLSGGRDMVVVDKYVCATVVNSLTCIHSVAASDRKLNQTQITFSRRGLSSLVRVMFNQ